MTQDEFTNLPPRQYRVGVVLVAGATPTFNALLFDTRAEAETYAADIARRWTAVLSTLVEEVENQDANHCEECGQWLEDPDRLGPTPGCGTCMADHLGSIGDPDA